MTKVISIWRIAADTPAYVADDLSGAGAKATGGRWNAPGVAMLYASETIALACLETLVHFKSGGMPFNRYLVRIDVPDAVWKAAEHFPQSVGWDALPAGRVSIDFGTQWAASGRSALLRVPSTIVPEESNVLVNPLHAHAAGLRVTKVRRWLYDPRFR
jgi:RES domain-containing protein